MAKKYRISKRRYKPYFQSGLWTVTCYTYGTCPLIPRAATHQEAIAMMDNHQWVWHTNRNTTKESNGSTN